MAESLTVNLQERSYPILFGADLGRDIRARVAALSEGGGRVAVLTDQQIATRQQASLQTLFGDVPKLVLPPGEGTKSLDELGRVLDFLAEQKLDRQSALFTVGGGVIGDLGGFAASCYLRGIDFYQVPTTLLAMVDSSVGGKTGINLRAGKNLAGAFHQPRGVFIATNFLSTLPPREFAAGMAEVIKCGLLGDSTLFTQLEGGVLEPADASLPSIIRRCCAIKAGIVAADERELAAEGGRALLNLGHTYGHAVEQVTGYGAYLHGEAVAIGLAGAARLSQKLGLLPAAAVARVERTVALHRLPVRLREALPLAALMQAMTRDKKVRAGALRFVLLRMLGEAFTHTVTDSAAVEAVWRELGAIA
ncbi:MAG: 3-dehydroquinate synthase [Opitutaceae bacterium]|nr:3-dehydroquinate synthase [Opitutaceae bacterium]